MLYWKKNNDKIHLIYSFTLNKKIFLTLLEILKSLNSGVRTKTNNLLFQTIKIFYLFSKAI